MKTNFNDSLVEVESVIQHFSAEDRKKIPPAIYKFIENYKSKDYYWEYDITKPLRKQEFSKYTMLILTYINTEFILNQNQKNLMYKFFKLNDKKM